jgi:hypothetical protein
MGQAQSERIRNGMRLKGLQAARIPGPIGKRSKTPFNLPVYRIVPARGVPASSAR